MTLMGADTFRVDVHVTESDLQLLVRIPSDIDSEWDDPNAFQTRIIEVVWDRLDKRSTLESIASTHETGDTVTLGTVTLTPDGTVVERNIPARYAAHSDG